MKFRPSLGRAAPRLAAPPALRPSMPALRAPAGLAPRVRATVTTIPRLRPVAIRARRAATATRARTRIWLHRIAGPAGRAVTAARPVTRTVTRVRTRVVTFRKRKQRKQRAPLFAGPSLGGFLSPSAGGPDEERRRQERVRQERVRRRETRTERVAAPQTRTRATPPARTPQRFAQARQAALAPRLPVPRTLPARTASALPPSLPRALPAPVRTPVTRTRSPGIRPGR